MKRCRRRACFYAVLTSLVLNGVVEAAALEPTDPASVGLLPQSIENLAAEMRDLVDDGKRAGIVSAVARHGKLVHLQAYGMRDLENELPMRADTLFRLYSMTRAITTVGLLTLFEAGHYEFADPVARFIPEFGQTRALVRPDDAQTVALKNPLTLYHLFTYTAGLGYPFSYPSSLGVSFESVLGVDATLKTGIRNLAGYPLLDQPGARWYYGFSGDVLGRVAEVISEQSYDEFLQTRVFDPLQMNDTRFYVRDNEADRLAQAYRSGEQGLANATASLPVINSYIKGKQMFSGGGGLVGTAMDYLRFAQMLLEGGELDGQQILKPETVELMLRNHLEPGQGPLNWYAMGRGTENDPFWNHDGYGWGLGIGVRLPDGEHRVPGGRGEVRWDGLANTTFFIDRENGIVAVAMSQYLGVDQIDLELILRRNLYGAMTR